MITRKCRKPAFTCIFFNVTFNVKYPSVKARFQNKALLWLFL